MIGMIGDSAYRVYLEEMGIIHWLTLDHIARPFRKFAASVEREHKAKRRG